MTGSAHGRPHDPDEAEQAIARRSGVFELAVDLKNVAEACRRSGMTRTEFYRFKPRLLQSGHEGLRDRAPVARQHPRAVDATTVARIAEAALGLPDAGCDRLAGELRGEGLVLSGATIHKHLARLGLATRRARWLALEGMARRKVRLDAVQSAFVARRNPCFGERRWAPSKPGECMAQDSMQLAGAAVPGKRYLHFAVDTFSGLAFAAIHDNKRPEAAVSLLHGAVLPFYEGLGLLPTTVVTGTGGGFRGSRTHPYALFLLLSEISQSAPRQRHLSADGFVLRFQSDLRRNWLAVAAASCTGWRGMQASLERWLSLYNSRTAFPGYPNYGAPPCHALDAWRAKTLADAGVV